MKKCLFFFLFFAVAAPAFAEFAFVHPGLLHSRQDLERIKNAVAAQQEPIAAGFAVFRAHPQSQSTYVMRGPLPLVGRNRSTGQAVYDSDANAAYQNAMMWAITGEAAYASKAKQIVNAWASTLKTINGVDAVLMAGLGPFKMVNAAEILRYTNAGWDAADARHCEAMFKNVVYPVLKDFSPFANGNWDTAALKTVMAIGVFCNDRAMFERAMNYTVNGAGDGRLTYYIYENGQCQESGRDQSHTQLGLAHLGDCCEIAWNQGLNLYAWADNRLLKGFEYTAKYNLGEDVPFLPDLDRTGEYRHSVIAQQGRGRLRPVFEQIYHHYANRMGLPAPYTQRAAERIRPEGGIRNADHIGFGTLLFSRPSISFSKKSPSTPPSSPAGVFARAASPSAITLAWVAPLGAGHYTVERAGGGPAEIIARDLKENTFTDTHLTPGTLYTYTISASNAAGESPASFPLCVSAGLPHPWAHQDVGGVAVPGAASFDGRTFTLEGAGTEIGGIRGDQFHFAYAPLDGDGTITARYVPQVSSQFSKFGVMLRDGLTSGSAQVALLIAPGMGRESWRRSGWNARLLTRTVAGTTTVTATSPNFTPPTVTSNRLTGPCWLRLARSGDTFTAAISPDGQKWDLVGTAKVPLPRRVFAGLSACSRLTKVTTTVKFNNVSLIQ